MIKFVKNEPACVVGKALVIGDIHIGLEKDLEKAGFRISPQTDILVSRIKRLVNENKSKELIILGDIKHSIAVRPDLDETKYFVEELKRFIRPILVQGNHDGALQNYLDIKVISGEGFKKRKNYFMHGHAKPKREAFKCNKIFSSHLHPMIEFRDSLGGMISEKVWLRGEKLIVVPAFNELLGGVDVRKSDLGPLRKQFDKKELDLYLLDGLYLGKIKNLKGLER